MNLNRICICLLVFAAVTVPVLATGNPHGRVSSSLLSEPSFQGDEGADYKAWYDANGAKDFEKAYDLAKAFVAKYPSSANTTYLKGWIPATRGQLFNTALGAKDVTKMLVYGNEALAEDATNVDYLYLLSVAIYNFEMAQNNFGHSSEEIDFNQRLIKQIEAGKVPANFAKDPNWKKEAFLGALYQQLGVIMDKKGDTEGAIVSYQKSAALDPKNSYNYLQIGVLTYRTKYKTAADKLAAFPPEKRNAPEPDAEVKAVLDEVNKQTDVVIEAWAHYMAVDAKPEASVKSGLTELYKFRHPDMPDGLQKLIDQYKGGAVNP